MVIVAALTGVVLLVGVEVTLLLVAFGVIAGLAWSFLAPRLTHRLIPKDVRESILVRPPVQGRDISCREFVYYSSIPGLFVFSVVTLFSDIANYQVASGGGIISLTVVTLFMLPLVFISASKMAVSTAQIDYVRGHYVRRIELIPYFEEFVGFGSMLGFLVYAGELLSKALSQAGPAQADIVSIAGENLGYIVAYLLLVIYPSTIATMIYMRLGFSKTRRRLLTMLKPSFLKLQVQFRCFNCGALLTGIEPVCPNCHTMLKPV